MILKPFFSREAEESRMNSPVKKTRSIELNPPDVGVNPKRSNKKLFFVLVVFALFIGLDVVILGFWFLGERNPAPEVPLSDGKVVVDTVAPAGQEADAKRVLTEPLRLEAENSLAGWLQVQAGAEAENVAAWGGEKYANIVALAVDGDASFAAGYYSDAREAYAEAALKMTALLATKTKLFQQALQEGFRFIDDKNSGAAVTAFSRALAMEPGNQEALHGLSRAANLDTVLVLLQSGEQLRQQGDLDGALAALKKGVSLDPEFMPVHIALARVEDLLAGQHFQSAMTSFLAALQRHDFSAATVALDDAARLQPGNAAVLNGQQQLRAARDEQQLAVLERAFGQQVAAEQWAAAVDVCKRALLIDGEVGFAVTGVIMARQRLGLDEQLKSILAAPDRLQEKGPYGEAIRIVEYARSLSPQGARLHHQVEAVARLLVLAAQEVTVILRSDNLTEVIIYRIGPQGRFVERQVQLPPGSYTLVGSRPGYRDVRKVLHVRAKNETIPTMIIQCEEPI